MRYIFLLIILQNERISITVFGNVIIHVQVYVNVYHIKYTRIYIHELV